MNCTRSDARIADAYASLNLYNPVDCAVRWILLWGYEGFTLNDSDLLKRCVERGLRGDF